MVAILLNELAATKNIEQYSKETTKEEQRERERIIVMSFLGLNSNKGS